MKQVIIFGASFMAEQVYRVLEELPEYQVIAFTDNDSKKWGQMKFGLPIISTEELHVHKDVLIVIASSYFAEIGEQLDAMGIRNYYESIQIIVGTLCESEREKLKKALSEEAIPNISLDYKIQKWEDCTQESQQQEKYLVICGGSGYPTKEYPASCAFAHQRVLQYKKQGLDIEAYSLVQNESWSQYEYETVNVYRGDYFGLAELLHLKHYKKLLIHFAGRDMMYAIKKAGCMDMPMMIWCHGFEVCSWTDTYFVYSEEELKKKKASLNSREKEKKRLFKHLFGKDNIVFVFVSEWLKNKAYKNIGILPRHYDIIHNFINQDCFEYDHKDCEKRKKILSVKSHATKKYANDITAKAIMELSQKPFFKDLTICLYGDGELWEENFGELKARGFSNVKLEKRFLSASEMHDIFKDYGIFLSPSRRDTQGVSNGEAMSAGLVVITCNTSAIPEFVDEDCGSLYEFDNYFQMAEEMEFLYNHPEEFLRKSQNAARRVREQCGYEATIAKELVLIKN